jgi:hypothetical protein
LATAVAVERGVEAAGVHARRRTRRRRYTSEAKRSQMVSWCGAGPRQRSRREPPSTASKLRVVGTPRDQMLVRRFGGTGGVEHDGHAQ